MTFFSVALNQILDNILDENLKYIVVFWKYFNNLKLFAHFLSPRLLSNRHQLCPGERSDSRLAHRLQQRWLLQVVGVPQSGGDAEKQHLQVGRTT